MRPEAVDITAEEAHGHSLFGASKAHRILPCPGSLLAEIGLPDTAGYEAAEGTVAHTLAERLSAIGERYSVIRAKDYEGWNGEQHTITTPQGQFTIEVTLDMLEYVAEYVQWCLDEPGEHLFEQRVDYSRLTPIPNQGGTADHMAMRYKHLTITDFKYGTGVQIFAERNPQAMLYALGAIFAWDWLYSFETVTIRICQPRLSHFDVWETTVAELMEFAEFAKGRFAEAWSADPWYKPGEKQCQFCKRRPACAAYVSAADRLADMTFNDERTTLPQIAESVEHLETGFFPTVSRPKAAELTSAQLGLILEYRKPFEAFFDAAFMELQRRVTAGQEDPPPGWMMAQGQTSRYIAEANEAEVEKLLLGRGIPRSDLYVPPSFRSPAQLEALIVGKLKLSKTAAVNLIRGLVTSVPGSPVLARRTPGKKDAPDLASESFVDERTTPESVNP